MTEVVRAMTSPTYDDVRGWLVAHGVPASALDDWVGRFTEREPRE